MDNLSQSSTQESSPESLSLGSLSPVLERAKRSHFTKNAWLGQYYKKELIDRVLKVFCCGCGKEFASGSHIRMISHLLRCKKSQADMPVTLDDIEGLNKTTITDLFVKALVRAGWTWKGVESREFKTFISKLTKTWKVPSRQEISGVHIPRLSLAMKSKFTESINHGYITHISIEFDHWDDANHRSYLGVLATTNSGDRYLLDLRDVSMRGKYADVTVEVLTEVFETLPPISINSIVSDSASACRKARQDITKIDAFKHVIHHRCLAHFINTIGSKITKEGTSMGRNVRLASSVTNIITSSSHWLAYIKELSAKKPHVYCSVRWYSMVTMLTALIDLKDVIVDKITPSLKGQNLELVNQINWEQMEEILDVVRPLSECIGFIERRDTSLGEAVQCIIVYAKELFSDDNKVGKSTEALIQARKVFVEHFNEDYIGREEFGMLLTSYALDRRFKLDYITPLGLKLCLETLYRLAAKTGATYDQIKICCAPEWKYFTDFSVGYEMTDDKPVLYWGSRPNGGILTRVGLRVAHLKASSANLERAFSSIKYIQGDYKLNMSQSTLLHMARLRISMKGESPSSQTFELDDWSGTEACIEQLNRTTLEDSFNSSSQSVQLVEDSNWIENMDVSTKKGYQSFLNYFDFSIVNVPKPRASHVEITDDQIRELLESSQDRLSSPDESVIVDSASQIVRTDGLMFDSNSYS